MEFKRLNRDVLKYKYIHFFIFAVIVLFGGIGAVVYFEKPIIMLPIVAILIIRGILVYYEFKVYQYRITQDAIDVKKGYIFMNYDIIPIERLHNIVINKGPMQKLFGLVDVSVVSAGSGVNISNIKEDEAMQISEFLKSRINHLALEKKQSQNSTTRAI